MKEICNDCVSLQAKLEHKEIEILNLKATIHVLEEMLKDATSAD